LLFIKLAQIDCEKSNKYQVAQLPFLILAVGLVLLVFLMLLFGVLLQIFAGVLVLKRERLFWENHINAE